MQTINDAPSPLSGLRRVQEYQEQRSHIFPGIQSIRWYIRQNRRALGAAGAVVTIAGRHWIHADKFDACVLEIGSRQREAA